MNRLLYGGIEAGGTYFVCGVGSGNGELIARKEIPTGPPAETFAAILEFFSAQPPVERIGIGSFGPLTLDTKSPDYGAISDTTKPEWSGVNIYAVVKRILDLPVNICTDTDAAAIGEYHHGKAQNSDNFLYLTIGTGIGGSILQNGKPYHGLTHTEMGHLSVPPLPKDHDNGGICKFHQYCLEGFASGPAIEQRYGQKGELIADPKIWDDVAYYLAEGLLNIIYTISPKLIIIGGSVIFHDKLLETVRTKIVELNNGYAGLPKKLEQYIVHASSDTIGVLGAIKFASISDTPSPASK